jgi:hypothetical protein
MVFFSKQYLFSTEDLGAWLGWSCLRTKKQGPWHKGVCFYLLPSFGIAFYTKSSRRPRQVPGQFPNRLEVIRKNVSGWFYKKECDVTFMHKKLVKNTKT